MFIFDFSFRLALMFSLSSGTFRKLNLSDEEVQSQKAAIQLLKRKEEIALRITEQFQKALKKEEKLLENKAITVMVKCELCQAKGHDQDHHEDIVEEENQLREDKNQQIKFILNDLINQNYIKENTVDMLKGKLVKNPLMLKAEKQNYTDLVEKNATLTERYSTLSQELDHQEIEKERVFRFYTSMLQDKLTLTNKVEELQRHIGFMEGLAVNQKEASTKKEKKLKEFLDNTRLQLEQEKVVKNMMLSELEKKESIAQSERASLVSFMSSGYAHGGSRN